MTILYFLPPFSLLTGSPSTNFAGVAAPEGVPGPLPALDSSSGTSSCKRTFRTRCPGGFRESHSTRKPEITGNRLHKCGQKDWRTTSYITRTSMAWNVPFLSGPCRERDFEGLPQSSTINLNNDQWIFEREYLQNITHREIACRTSTLHLSMYTR